MQLKNLILARIPEANITVDILNPIMGASCGPKTLTVYFVGKEKPNTDNL